MKRGLVFTATLAALSMGIVACQKQSGGGKKENIPDISINNKASFEADWFVEDADKPLQITIADGTPVADAIYDGDLVVTSDHPDIVSVTASMLAVHAESAGTAKITATYKNKKSDSVDITVKTRPSMRVVTQIDTSKTDYLMSWKIGGEKLYAKDEMNGFYIAVGTIDNAAPISVQLDDNPVGDYKYTIKIGTKTIGAYKGSHNNIGFVGDQVDDGGPKDLVKALFKFNANYTFSTNFFGATDYFLAAYKGTSNDRLAFQTGDGIANDAFARLYEYGDPIPATAISVTPAQVSVHAGATVKLEAAVTPANSTDEVVWSSSNTQVATVDQSGLVTGVAQNETPVTITATAGSVSATATVTVTEALNYGTEENPLTVAQAKAFLDANFPSSTTVEEMYVTGTVSSATYSTKYSNWEIWLYDGETAQGFELYSTVLADGLDGNKLQDGAVVKAHGYAKIYNTTYELTNTKIGTSTVYPQVYSLEYTAPELTGVEVSPATKSVDVAAGAVDQQFTAAAFPAGADLGTVVWSIAPQGEGAVISSTGLVTVQQTAVEEDQTKDFTITATTEGGIAGTATLTVTRSTGGGGEEEQKSFVVDFSLKSASHSSYGDTWTYGDVTVSGGANNNGGWDYIKMGGKSATISAEGYPGTYIKTNKALDFAVKTVTLDLLGKSYNQANEKAVIHIESYSDAALTTKVAQTDSQEVPYIGTAGAQESLTFTFATAQANLYYKVVVDITNTTTYNGVFCLQKVTFATAA